MFIAYVLTFCRITIALVFALAFLGKIRNIAAFQEAISDFRLLPENWSKVIAGISLSLEFAIVLLMLAGQDFLFSGFLLATGLLISFSIALAITLFRKMKVTCRCFGWAENRVSPYDLVRNALFILCGVIGVWTFFLSPQSIPGSEAILVGFISLHYVILAVNLADVFETLRRPFRILGVS